MTSKLYHVFGTVLESDIELPELPAALRHEVPDWSCHARAAASSDTPSPSSRIQWLHRSHGEDGRVWIAVGRRGSGYVIRVPRIAEFAIAADGSRIQWQCVRGLPPHTLRHLLLDHVLPRVLDLRGALVLHAGAVATSAGAVLLLGGSGRGKSTLTTSLAQRGFEILGDDVIVLRMIDGCWHAVPSYPGLRLWSDSADRLLADGGCVGQVAHYTDKTRGDARSMGARFATGPVSLARAYVLEPAAADAIPAVGAMSPGATFGEVAAHTFRFDPGAREALRDELATLGHLAMQPWFRTLSVPRSYDALDLVHDTIVRDLERGVAA